jgi:hypothetical protein
MLVRDLHIRVIKAATGELQRELTLDPTRSSSVRDSSNAAQRPWSGSLRFK